ncbi:MAG: hypothetical protein RLZZ373_451 [Pseudomonadota bacterium]|jgi:uncharacterized protein (DUF2141 family)
MNSDFRFTAATLRTQRSGFHRWLVQILIAAFAVAGNSVLAAPDSNALVVQVVGFKNDSGHAIAKLFIRGDDVLKKGREEVSGAIRNGQSTLTFPAVPPGEYAVVVFHDANDNGTIEHNFIGFPKDALGFSNGFAVSITTGLPNFEKLRFTHGSSLQTIAIKVQ